MWFFSRLSRLSGSRIIIKNHHTFALFPTLSANICDCLGWCRCCFDVWLVMGRLCFWLIPSLCSRYKRVFSVGTHGITTYNPTTLEVTNQVSMNENAFMMYEPLLLPPVPHRCLWDVLLLALCGPHFLNGLVSQLWIYFSVFIGAQNLILLYCCIIASYKTFIFMLLVHLEALGNFLNVWTGLLML